MKLIGKIDNTEIILLLDLMRAVFNAQHINGVKVTKFGIRESREIAGFLEVELSLVRLKIIEETSVTTMEKTNRS